MFWYFLIDSLVVGLMLIASLCPLGSMMLWRKMPYIGDSIAHASILGIVIALFYGFNITLSLIGTAVLFVGIIVYLRHEEISNILVVIFSYSFMAVGLFLMNFVDNVQQTDIFSYLFGDILLVSNIDIICVGIVSIIVLLWLVFRWRSLLLSAISEDLAIIEGCNTKRLELELMLAVALVVVLSIKIVGVLLVAALLIIPVATARNISNTPVSMVIKSVIVGMLSILMGLLLSYVMDSPSGPSIIVLNVIFFILSLFYKRLFF
jgi:zinc transport system permease protein